MKSRPLNKLLDNSKNIFYDLLYIKCHNQFVMKKNERKKWNEDNILLASQYLKDAYRTFNDPYCETYYINAIELLTRSLLFTLYTTELSDEKVKAVKEMIDDGRKMEERLK